ncbi:MAG: hypothetical protein JXB18_15200, partial [Sedimentisphaerales bacterium]|nr:hypothetical protein [Sedimentisphaerales bacterium]
NLTQKLNTGMNIVGNPNAQNGPKTGGQSNGNLFSAHRLTPIYSQFENRGFFFVFSKQPVHVLV